MKKIKNRSKLSQIVRWTLWVVLVQFVLINISAALHAYRLTHFYDKPDSSPDSKNIFAKTWRLFTGPRYTRSLIADIPAFSYDSVTLKTADDIPIQSWYSGNDTARGTVIFFHGITANKSYLLAEAVEFKNAGYNVMLVDLRAHGTSGGANCTVGVKEGEEVKLAYDYAAQRGNKNILLYGVSMGAVVISKAVADYGVQPAAVILDMPFASLHDHLRARARTLGFPQEPFGALVTFWTGVERGYNGFNHTTCRYVKKINCPVLMQWGTLDNFVLRSETDRIFKCIASPKKELVVYEQAGHESFLYNDPEKWRKEVNEFLTSIM